MELQFFDSFDFIVDDMVDIELPSYVSRLNPAEVSQNIILITGDGKMLVFDTTKYFIPPGPSAPCDGGKQLFFANINNRWPCESQGFFANADWIIEKSSPALSNAKLEFNNSSKNKLP